MDSDALSEMGIIIAPASGRGGGGLNEIVSPVPTLILKTEIGPDAIDVIGGH